MDRCIWTTLQLVSSEIAEATEAERKDLMDDHLPHRKGGEVELADALIRMLDLAGRYGWVLVRFDMIWRPLANNPFAMHLSLNKQLIGLVEQLQFDSLTGHQVNMSYSMVVSSIIRTANALGYDIYSAMDEKLTYNRQRVDHKRENRAKPGGKKV